jgi:hypothetical protein
LLETTKSNIEANTLETITSHNSTGAIMQAGIQSYLVATKVQSDLTAATTQVVNYRQPSYGTFGTSLNVSYFFGIPNKVGFSGVVMDVDRLADNAESKTNCWDVWSDFNRQTGAMASYLENLIPEQLFSTEENQLDGISAVKALAIAGQQGQKIYTLTSANANLLSEITIESTSRQEIQSALNAGKEVTVHQEPINEFGWTGSGYVVIDPDSGAGGYIISGGGNGGQLITPSALLLGLGALLIIFALLNPATALGLIAIITGALFVGCGLSSMFNDGKFFNYAALSVNLFFGYLGKIATSGASILASFTVLLDIGLIEGDVSGKCSRI